MADDDAVLFFDTVTLSNFALAGHLDLLIARYGVRACVTLEVLDEVTDGIVAGFAALADIEAAVSETRLGSARTLTDDEREQYRELLRILGPGEASCIACAEARGGVVVTDDRTARSCCAERGLSCTGTVGILKACAVDGTLSPDEADAALQAMIDAGYYSPVTAISGLL